MLEEFPDLKHSDFDIIFPIKINRFGPRNKEVEMLEELPDLKNTDFDTTFD